MESERRLQQLPAKRIAWIDAAKGILILSIILGHFGSSGINRIVFIYHVGGFFLLSGYTMKVKRVDRSYICQRFTRLMRPYFYTCFMILLADALMQAALKRNAAAVTASIIYDLKRSFWASGDNRLFGPVDIGGRIGAIWFLPAMFFAVIFTQVILNLISDWKRRFAAGTVLYCAAIVSARYIWLPFSLQSAWMAVVFILLGKYFREKEILDNLKLPVIAVGAAFLVLMTVFGKSGMNFVIGYADDFILAPVCMVIASVLIFLLSRYLARWRLLCWIGRNSLKIMCLHLFVLECAESPVIVLLGRAGRGFGIGTYLCLMLSFTMLITLAEEKLCKFVRQRRSAGRAAWLRIAAEPSERDVVSMMVLLLGLLILLPRFGASGDYDTMVSAVMPVSVLFLGGYLAGRNRYSLSAGIVNLIRRVLFPYAVFCAAAEIVRRPDIIGNGGIYILPVLAADLVLVHLIIHYTEHAIAVRWMIILMLSLAGALMGEHGLLPLNIQRVLPVDLMLYGLIDTAIGYGIGQKDLLRRRLDYPMYFILSPIWASMLFLGGTSMTGRHLEPYGTVVLGTAAGFGLLWLLARALMQYLPFRLEKLIRAAASGGVWIYAAYHLLSGII